MEIYAHCADSEYKHLCPVQTRNLGLCVENISDCDIIITNRDERMQPKIEGFDDLRGKDYAYDNKNLHNNCGIITKITDMTFENYNYVGNNIKICSWNVWGLLKYKQPFMTWSLNKRINNIIDIIN